jgi:hypothetical protein
MSLQIPVEEETFPADGAVVGPRVLMKSLVCPHVAFVRETFVAEGAFKWLLS